MDIIDRLHGSALTSKLIDDAIDEIERMRLIVAALEAERDQLRAELAEYRQDAERYRWLRVSKGEPYRHCFIGGDDNPVLKIGIELDDAIDAARKGEGEA